MLTGYQRPWCVPLLDRCNNEGREAYRSEPPEREEDETAPAERRLAVREVLDIIQQRFYAIEEATAGWEDERRTKFLARWIGQLGTMAREVRRTGVNDFVKEMEIPAEQLDGTESQQLRRARRPVTREEWLQKKAAEWDKREERRKQEEEDSQLRRGQWLPPKGSQKRQRRATARLKHGEIYFLPSDCYNGSGGVRHGGVRHRTLVASKHEELRVRGD